MRTIAGLVIGLLLVAWLLGACAAQGLPSPLPLPGRQPVAGPAPQPTANPGGSAPGAPQPGQPAPALPAFCGEARVTDHPPSMGTGYTADTRNRPGGFADVWHRSGDQRETSILLPTGVVVDFPGANGKDWVFPAGCTDEDIRKHYDAHKAERPQVWRQMSLDEAVAAKLAVVRQ